MAFSHINRFIFVKSFYEPNGPLHIFLGNENAQKPLLNNTIDSMIQAIFNPKTN